MIKNDSMIDDLFDDKTELESKEHYDFDEIDSIPLEEIESTSYLDEEFVNSEHYVNTGSIDEFGKERVSKVTGKKVTNYVDNDTFCNAVVDWKLKCEIALEEGQPKPKMPDVIGIAILRIADGLSRRYNFRNYCVDEETEALTQRGWLKYDQITTDDIILSMDVSDGKLKWSPIHEIFRNENYDGEMFSIQGESIDALVTPHHKFIAEKQLKKIEDICDEHIITNGISVDATNPDYSNSTALADVSLGDFTLEKIITMEYPHREKLIELLHGSPHSDCHYTTINEEHSKLYLMLLAMNGYTPHYNSHNGVYSVYTVLAKDHYVKDKLKPTTHYKGTVWCPRTDYGTFMCRRGKSAYITGNTYIDEMREDAIYMAIRAVKNYDPRKSNNNNAFGYFNRVIWTAMVTRIKVEKEEYEKKMSLLKDPMYLGYQSQDAAGDDHIDKNRMISVYDNM